MQGNPIVIADEGQVIGYGDFDGMSYILNIKLDEAQGFVYYATVNTIHYDNIVINSIVLEQLDISNVQNIIEHLKQTFKFQIAWNIYKQNALLNKVVETCRTSQQVAEWLFDACKFNDPPFTKVQFIMEAPNYIRRKEII